MDLIRITEALKALESNKKSFEAELAHYEEAMNAIDLDLFMSVGGDMKKYQIEKDHLYSFSYHNCELGLRQTNAAIAHLKAKIDCYHGLRSVGFEDLI